MSTPSFNSPPSESPSSESPPSELIPAALAQRPMLGSGEVEDLATLFGVLANDTRLLILHAIARAGEASVSDIAAEVGASSQAVSNHLQRMADKRIVTTRRDGNRIYYQVIDPCVGGVMELGLCLLGYNPNC